MMPAPNSPWIGIVFLLVSTSYATEDGILFPFGAREGDSFLEPNDDGSSGEVPISIPFPFFDHNHDALFVNTNGVISFLIQVSQFTPDPFPLDGDRRVVAVFWGDVIVHSVAGNVSYRELHRTPSNEHLFARADGVIRWTFIDQSRFSSFWLFIATWDKVPFYGATPDAYDITNTFQTVLVTNGRHSFAIYNYDEIQWTTGTASGGNSSGLGGTPAQVGFNAGDGFTFFAVDESRTDAIIDIDEDSNIGMTGRFLFRIDSSDIVDSGCNTGGSLAVFPVSGSMLGGDVIHVSGPCFGPTSDIVCDFAGVQVAGQLTNNSAVCISPAAFHIGRLPLTMSVNGGESFNFSGIYTYLSVEDILAPQLTRIDSATWYERQSLTVTWDTDVLKDYVEYVRISVYAYVEDLATGEVKLDYIFSLQDPMTLYEEGTFTFSHPAPPDSVQHTVGAIRLSQYKEGASTELDLPGFWSDVHNLRWLYPVPDPADWCSKWLEEARSDLDYLVDTEPCPCTLAQALVDAGRFSHYPLCSSDASATCGQFKSGAVLCVRANTPSNSGGGQECCYGDDDNILDVALGALEGGGFAERRHHAGVEPYKAAGLVPYLSHWVADILPWEHCCVLSERHCVSYGRFRPSQTCENYTPPTPAIGTGDPHLITMDGLEYTFNGLGEYTMLETCDGDFELQTRMAVLEPGSRATVITALAARHSGQSDLIHIEVSERRGIDVWFRKDVNGSEWTMLDFEETPIIRVELEGVTVFFREVNNSGVVAKNAYVNFQCGVSLVVSNTAGLLSVFTSLQQGLKGRTRGLYGNWNGDKTDDLEKPDGMIVPANATSQEIHAEFGQKWQIRPENSLFRYPRGKGPSDYADANYQPIFWSPSDAVDDAVVAICGDDPRCAFDYAVTGNVAIAVATMGAITSYIAAVESSVIVICPALPVPLNGARNVSRSNVGGVASFACDDGFTLQGEGELVCQENGNWTGYAPLCVGDAPLPLGLEGWQLGLIIAGSCLLLVVIVAVLIKVVMMKAASKE